MADLRLIIDYCDRLLEVEAFEDHCPNGLQVEAGGEVRRIVSGVTASLALIEAATQLQADLLLVHHGYFWKGEPQPLVGMKGRRVAALYRGGISLAAYHLPLDAHPELGNNAMLGRLLEIDQPAAVAESGLLWAGGMSPARTAEELSAFLEERLGRPPLWLAGGPSHIKRVAWCSGAAQGFISRAADLGCQAFISGEVSEQTFHQASELGIHYFAAGHHATERYGIQALGETLAGEFGVEHRFVDLQNPV